jgi:hypothetical protein
MSDISFPPPPVFGISHDKSGSRGMLTFDDVFDLYSHERDNTKRHPNSVGDNDFDDDDDSNDGDDFDLDGDGKKRKRPKGTQKNMTELQKVERRYAYSEIFVLV